MVIQNNVVYKIELSDIKHGTVVIPDGIITIGDYAAQNLLELKQLFLPQTCRHLGRSVFNNTGLEQFIIPLSIQTAGELLFEGCENLTSVKISNPDLKIRGNWFDYCPLLTSITHGALKTNVAMFNNRCVEILQKMTVDIYKVFYVQQFKEEEKFYVANREKIWASSDELSNAIEECALRYSTLDIVEKYKYLNLDSRIRGVDYKIITNACNREVERWLKEKEYKWTEEFSVKQLMKEFEGRFGYKDFAQFIADRYADRAK